MILMQWKDVKSSKYCSSQAQPQDERCAHGASVQVTQLAERSEHT